MSETTTPEQSTPAPVKASRGPSTMQLLIVVAILGGGIVFTALTSDVSKVSEPGVKLVNGEPFLPEAVGDWKGGELTGLTEIERAVLPSDTEGARRVYTDTKGREVYFTVVLAGRDVTSIHRPELCLKGQGWVLTAPRIRTIETPAAQGGALEVSCMNATRGDRTSSGRVEPLHTEFVYWFVGKDRTTPHHWQRILWSTADRVIHNRNHRWAYFLLGMTVDPREIARDSTAAHEQTEQLARQFIAEIYPSLVVN